MPARKRGRRACFFVLLCLLVGCDEPAAKREPASTPGPQAPPPLEGLAAGSDLAAARANFESKLRHEGPAPDTYRHVTPPAGVRQVYYTSDGMRLKAWLSEDPGDGRRHPAVVFLHGGWMFGAVDWEDASGFVDAGFVLMIPMLRGENGNPGVYTGFYREVDDAIAAGRYVASLPYVDPDRVFVAGHSVGAVLTTLTAMMPSPYKAGAALSGYLDMEHWVTFSTPEQVVFDIRDPNQVRMRNPFAFIPSLRIPLLLLAEPGFMYDISDDFCRKARRLGKPCEIRQVPGDHLTMAKPGVKIAAQWFRKQMHD